MLTRPSADEIIRFLGLAPLPGEGGFFRETYRSTQLLRSAALGERYNGPSRSLATCIYYLLKENDFSALHRLRTDEIYHFYAGDTVELTTLDLQGRLIAVTLGNDLLAGQHCQFLVPAGTWQGSRLSRSGGWALLGTTMSPGFDFSDCELADAALLEQWPEHAQALKPLIVLNHSSR